MTTSSGFPLSSQHVVFTIVREGTVGSSALYGLPKRSGLDNFSIRIYDQGRARGQRPPVSPLQRADAPAPAPAASSGMTTAAEEKKMMMEEGVEETLEESEEDVEPEEEFTSGGATSLVRSRMPRQSGLDRVPIRIYDQAAQRLQPAPISPIDSSSTSSLSPWTAGGYTEAKQEKKKSSYTTVGMPKRSGLDRTPIRIHDQAAGRMQPAPVSPIRKIDAPVPSPSHAGDTEITFMKRGVSTVTSGMPKRSGLDKNPIRIHDQAVQKLQSRSRSRYPSVAPSIIPITASGRILEPQEESSQVQEEIEAQTTDEAEDYSNDVVIKKETKEDLPGSEKAPETSSRLFLRSIPPIASNTKRLYLVRHGEVIPPGGQHGVLYGCLDVPLSELGKQEAVAAADFFETVPLQQICSSPLSRAVYGANQVMRIQEKNFREETMFKRMIVDVDFTELSRGEWAGKTRQEIGEETMKKFNQCDLSVTPKGGESYPAIMKRVLAARDALLQYTDTEKASCVVSHLQVTRCIISDAMDVPLNEIVDISIATASISCVDYNMDTGEQTVIFTSFKPEVGLEKAKDSGNDV